MLAAPPVEFLATVALFIFGQEYRDEFVAAFSDVAPRLLEAHIVSEPDHGFPPRASAWRSTESKSVSSTSIAAFGIIVLRGRIVRDRQTNRHRVYFSPSAC
jgi:hypothetical protein